MKIAIFSIAMLAACLTARADFSYTTTMKTSGGMMGAGAAGAADRVSKHYLKGNKVKIDHGDTAIIFDLDAETFTSIRNSEKTYTVKKFSDLGEWRDKVDKAGVEINVDVKDTGQRKTINGFNTHEVVMTTEMDSAQARQAGGKMQMEMSMWVSRDVPGSQEVIAFYKKNAGRFPWAALLGGSGGSNPRMQKAITDLYRKMAAIDGVSVLQITKMKAALNPAQKAQMDQAMAQARVKLEEAKRKGGQEGAMAERTLAMMAQQAGGSMFETTSESSNFSTSSIPDAVFAIPAGYRKTEK